MLLKTGHNKENNLEEMLRNWWGQWKKFSKDNNHLNKVKSIQKNIKYLWGIENILKMLLSKIPQRENVGILPYIDRTGIGRYFESFSKAKKLPEPKDNEKHIYKLLNRLENYFGIGTKNYESYNIIYPVSHTRLRIGGMFIYGYYPTDVKNKWGRAKF